MAIIDGKALAQKMQAELAEKTAKLKEKSGQTPGLVVILVGENPKLCKEVKKYNIGYGLPSTLKYYDKFKLELDKILANLDSFDYNKIKVKELLEKIKKQKRNLKKFLIEE